MKKLILFVFLFSAGNIISAQSHKIDSLKNRLEKVSEDTNKAIILSELATELQWHGNYDTALILANQSLQLSKKINYKAGEGNAFLVLGQTNTGINEYSKAHAFFDSCISIRQELNDQEGLAEAYISIAEIYHMEDNYPQGINQLVKAEKIYEALKDTSKLNFLYSAYGMLYIDFGHIDEGINYLNKAVNAYSKNGDLNRVADNLSILSLAYLEKGSLTDALLSVKKAIAIRAKSKQGSHSYDNLYLAKVYVQIGEKLEGERKYSKSKDTFELALKEMSSIAERFERTNDYSGKVNSYITLGRIYLGLNNLFEAERFLNMCLDLSLQTSNLFEARDSYLYLSKLHSKDGKVADAFENFQKYVVYRDSIVNQNSTKQIAQIQMQYAFEKEEAVTRATQEKKDALAIEELERQKVMRNGSIGGFVAMLFFAIIFFAQRNKIRKSKKLSDTLLLNILPSEVAEELKQKGFAEARLFNDVTIMFTDFENFTQISENLSPSELITEIDTCFKAFDRIIGNHKIEKIKTIGDSYMCAGGLPIVNETHAIDVVDAAMEIQQFVQKYVDERIQNGLDPFRIRIGIHTGPVVAGIVGLTKFAYDIWGDTVNIASRMESSGQAGKINISGSTYQLVKEKFRCTYRGKIQAKNKGEVDMYFVDTDSTD